MLISRRWIAMAAVCVALWVGGCAADAPSTPTATDTEDPSAPTDALAVEGAEVGAGLPTLSGSATVEMAVNGGTITIEVDGDNAPITAGNFVDLVNRGVYDGVAFHRVVREPQPFVVQGGDPQSTDPSVPAQQLGTGSFIDPDTGNTRYIPLEIKPASAEEPLYGQTFEQARVAEPPLLTHNRGAVAMARSQFPDSASAQFYFALADLPFLDGSYAVFGRVTEGMDVVDEIQQGDRIDSATVTSGLENLSSQ